MHLSHIAATAFKGRTFSHSLEPLTIIAGENASGKSAVVEALRLALIGYDPRLPKKKADIFHAFASAPKLNITASFSDGVSNIVNLSCRNDKVTGMIEINREIPAVLFDLGEYFGLSKDKRVEFILGRCLNEDDAMVLQWTNDQIAGLDEKLKEWAVLKKQVEGSISNREAQAAETLQEPRDRSKEINDLKLLIADCDQRLGILRAEHATVTALNQELERLRAQRDKAVEDAPVLVCEHCGNTITQLQMDAEAAFAPLLTETNQRLQSSRTLSLIVQEAHGLHVLRKQHWDNLAEAEAEQGRRIALMARKQDALRDDRELETLNKNIETARAELKVRLKEKKDLLALKVGPLMEMAGVFFKAVMGKTLEWEDGEIGYRIDSGFVSMRVFSGAEELMAIGGLQVALAQSSPVKIVVMDELGRLSKNSKTKLLKAVQVLLKKGEIDQFIGLETDGAHWSGQHLIEIK